MLLDIKIVKSPGPVLQFPVDDRTTSGAAATIKPGEPIKKGGTGNNFAILLADGDPKLGSTNQPFLGIAKDESTETSTADGVVNYYTIVPGLTVLRGRSTTVANINTAAKLNAIMGDYITFDLTNGAFTIDEDEGDDPNVRGLQVVGGDIVKGTLDVLVHALASAAAPLTGQTMD